MPASYPVIPLVQFYNDSVEFDSRANLVEQGKGGVKDRSFKHFINATKRSYSINATLRDRDELQQFLETNRGLPFEFRFDGSTPTGLFVCKSWNWSWLVFVGGAGGVWKLSLKLEEVFRPGWSPVTTGSGSIFLPPIQIVGSGSIIQSNPVGSGILQLPSLVVSGTGSTFGIRTGSGSISIPVLTMSAMGAIVKAGVGELSLGAIELTGSGNAGPPFFSTGGDLQLSAIELSGSGSLTMNGSGAINLPAITASGTGNLVMSGSGAIEAGGISATGIGIAIASSTPWTPAAITTALWLDASDNSTLFDATSAGSLPGSDGAIARWEDKSGNGRHLTQFTSSSRPIRKATELNSLDMIRFDGSDDFLSGTVQNLTAFTAIFVNKNLNGSIAGASPISYTDGTYWTGSVVESNAGIIYQRIGPGNVQYGVQATSVSYNTALGRISVVRCSTTTDNAWIDGSILPVDNASLYTLSQTGTFNVGRREVGPVYTSGDIGEVLLVASAISTNDRQKAEGYLAHKWGLTSSLPIDHPHKTTPPNI